MNVQIKGLDFIRNIVDKSDFMMTRYRVYYTNGIELSVIRGFGSYGNNAGLFEIMIMNHDFASKNFLLEEFGLEDDDVIGYLTEDELVAMIISLGNARLRHYYLDTPDKSVMIEDINKLTLN